MHLPKNKLNLFTDKDTMYHREQYLLLIKSLLGKDIIISA